MPYVLQSAHYAAAHTLTDRYPTMYSNSYIRVLRGFESAPMKDVSVMEKSLYLHLVIYKFVC